MGLFHILSTVSIMQFPGQNLGIKEHGTKRGGQFQGEKCNFCAGKMGCKQKNPSLHQPEILMEESYYHPIITFGVNAGPKAEKELFSLKIKPGTPTAKAEIEAFSIGRIPTPISHRDQTSLLRAVGSPHAKHLLSREEKELCTWSGVPRARDTGRCFPSGVLRQEKAPDSPPGSTQEMGPFGGSPGCTAGA